MCGEDRARGGVFRCRLNTKRVTGFGKIKTIDKDAATRATEEDQEEAYVDVAYTAAIK